MLGFLDCREQSSVNTAVQIPLPDPAFSSFTTQFYLQRNNITFFVFFFFDLLLWSVLFLLKLVPFYVCWIPVPYPTPPPPAFPGQ